MILLDVQMPGLDGFETAELIRARERSRAVPIIFVTAISKERHHVFRGYETGAVDYLFKPLDPVVLRSKVEVFVESYERGRALAEREELLRATFDDAPIGMARADVAGPPAPRQPRAVRDRRAARRRISSGARSTSSARAPTPASTRRSAASSRRGRSRATRSSAG